MADAPPVWVIDTSSILEIRGIEKTLRVELYSKLTALVKAGRLKYPKQVVDELKRGSPKAPDLPFKWAHDNAHIATAAGPSLEEVKAVLGITPKVLDPNKDSGGEEADAYVLALAIEIKRKTMADVRVVTNESRDLPSKMSMSTAAGLLAIPSVPLRGFLHAENILAF
jgi:hypothetical protein